MDEELLLRPVKEGMINFESLLSGSITLGHIAMMNDYLDCQDYNTSLKNG